MGFKANMLQELVLDMMDCEYLGTSLSLKFLLTINRYTVKSYGHKLIDDATHTYSCRIILSRCSDQLSQKALLDIPSASQMDEWDLYNRIIENTLQ